MGLKHVSECMDEIKIRVANIKNQYTGTYTEPPARCEKCGGQGFTILPREPGAPTEISWCECETEKRNFERLERSGLKHAADILTFDTFIAAEPWQASVKEKALQYLNDNANKWYFAGGQVGCGKTHICTAIAVSFMRQGYPALYMRWRDEVGALRDLMFSDDAGDDYTDVLQRFKTVRVLYIDDFFKFAYNDKSGRPKPSDINIAFEILNYRYNDPRLITIISSEHSIDALIDFDEAIGSRIYQRTKDYCTYIRPDRAKNFRLNPAETEGKP